MNQTPCDDNRIKQHGRTLMLSAFLLAILVAVTGTLLISCLYRYVRRSDAEISLCAATGEATDSPTIQAAARVKASEARAVQSSIRTYTGAEARAQAQKRGVYVEDAEQVWETETAIELFHASYQGVDGAITVESQDGSHVIAPGTEGKYTFSLKNAGRRSADYKVWVEAELGNGLDSLPVETRMTGQQGWLVGGTDNWGQALDLNGVSEEGHIRVGGSEEYTIYWKWPFERGQDETDTALGDAAVLGDLTYTVTIYTMAVEQTGGAGGGDGDSHGNPIYDILRAPQTGDTARLTLWLGGLLAGTLGILFLVSYRKKKKAADVHEERDNRDGTSA